MVNLEKIWKDKDVAIATKKKIRECLSFSVVMYGCESNTIRGK